MILLKCISNMPQRQSLFADLGRPTKRGIRKCPKCGTINGTRGNSCKNKSCDVVFRDNGASKKSSTEACRVTTNILGLQVFSVRLRDRGPDYRNFVQLPLGQSAIAGDPSVPVEQSPQNVAKCYVDACVKSKEFPCNHILAAQRCFCESQPLKLKHSSLATLNIPADYQDTLSMHVNENSDVLVQRVSKTSFIVKCNMTSKHPLGYLHIMFLKHSHKDDGSLDKKFLCTCKPFKAQNRDNESSQTNTADVGDISFKFCFHYHACLCAFASDDNLSSEFEYFLNEGNQDCAPTLLSQLHLVTLPTATSTTVDGIDANQISVEIMQENISLLESIAAADDATLHNVQGLEGVLSDQIIVTNVDDSLSFGEAPVLDALDDGDSQVCQIFANTHSAIQLANAFSNAENVHQTVNITSAVMQSPTAGKKRRQGSGDCNEMEIATTTHTLQPLVNTNHLENVGKPFCVKSSISKGFQTSTITLTTPTSGPTTSTQLRQPDSPTIQENQRPDPFELWLSAVNERLNATMNYHFSGKPAPIIFYISLEYFEKLKERITYGVKKKRLPNQSVIITRTDKPPAGTFTKHVWKITNVIHVLQIFHNPIIPLKISQFFMKGPNGVFEEWIPPSETDRRNQLIKPHVHSTYLKVGKNDPTATESVPFVIEWIPDILPQSKLGELSLTFEFGHSEPREDLSTTKGGKSVQL